MYPSAFAHLHSSYAPPTSDVPVPRKPRRRWSRRRMRSGLWGHSSMPANASRTG
jgi:hypothetical protein